MRSDGSGRKWDSRLITPRKRVMGGRSWLGLLAVTRLASRPADSIDAGTLRPDYSNSAKTRSRAPGVPLVERHRSRVAHAWSRRPQPNSTRAEQKKAARWHYDGFSRILAAVAAVSATAYEGVELFEHESTSTEGYILF